MSWPCGGGKIGSCHGQPLKRGNVGGHNSARALSIAAVFWRRASRLTLTHAGKHYTLRCTHRCEETGRLCELPSLSTLPITFHKVFRCHRRQESQPSLAAALPHIGRESPPMLDFAWRPRHSWPRRGESGTPLSPACLMSCGCVFHGTEWNAWSPGGRTLPFGDYGAGRAARGLDVTRNTNILILHTSKFYYSRNDALQFVIWAF